MEKKNVVIAGIASLAVVAAAAYLVIRKRQAKKREAAPANAPQLELDNPGEQSEFLAGAGMGQGLG